MTDPNHRFVRHWLTLAGGWLVISILTSPVGAQVLDDAQDREIFDLQLKEQQLRRNVDSNRVSRQVDVLRLETRIEELEAKLREVERTGNGMNAWSVLNLIELLAAGEQTSQPAAEREEEAPAQTDDGSRGSVYEPRVKFARLMAEDYMLSLQGELIKARIELVRANEDAKTVDRLRIRGLATEAQYNLAKLEHQSIALRVERLEKQLDGLRELLPAKAEPSADLPAPEVDDEPAED